MMVYSYAAMGKPIQKHIYSKLQKLEAYLMDVCVADKKTIACIQLKDK
jgi:hypothetical protein